MFKHEKYLQALVFTFTIEEIIWHVKKSQSQSLGITYNMQAHNPTPLHLYYTPLYTFSMYLNQLIAGIRCHLQSVDLDTQKKLQQYCPNINNNNQTNINNKVKPKQKSSHSPFLSLVTTCSFSSYGAPSQRHSASFNIG